ncbi:MAG TPA: zinc-ribbon domain-containing protein [Candidatus Agathobaculum pullistercoris]|nr:zinc-ribbon domain-containing protein [uncultured Agathobaculum sp.]HIX10128.1 zinc-ribbon domain-containing protein [Candidatus Agathobaculum pullistercoris]
MALIQCKNCGKDVSDRAKVCPHCGTQLIEDEVTQPQPIICEECGAEIPQGADSCPNCGCPVPVDGEENTEAPQKVELTSVKIPKLDQRKKKIVVGSIIGVIVLIAAISLIISQMRQATAAQLSADYSENISTVSAAILSSAIQTEEAGNLIHDVWYNCIFEENDPETNEYTRPNGYYLDDFNDALANLFSDETFSQQLSSIKNDQETVTDLMRKMSDPPEEFEDAYEALRELFDAYTEFTNLVINPSGNLQTFTSNFNDADSALLNCYNAMSLYIDA